jgi:hypothetical protein
MPILMTNREMALFRVALWYCKQYHNCCPDMGMGPSIHTLAKEVMMKVGYPFDEDDIAECCESISGS